MGRVTVTIAARPEQRQSLKYQVTLQRCGMLRVENPDATKPTRYAGFTNEPPPPPPAPPAPDEPAVTPPVDDPDEPLDPPVAADDTEPSGDETPPGPQGGESLPLPAPQPGRPLPPPTVDVEAGDETEDAGEPADTQDSQDEGAEEEDASADVLAGGATETTDPATTYPVKASEVTNGGRLTLPRRTQTVAFDPAVLAAVVATLNGGVQPLSDGLLTVAGENATVDVDAQNPSLVTIARGDIGSQLTFTLQIAGITVGELQLVVADARLLSPVAVIVLLLAGAGVGLIAVGLRRKNREGAGNKTSLV